MVLAAVDDLLFSAKIRTVARHVGVEVVFARSSGTILEQVRTARPALAIFDLNSPKTDPLGTIAAIKGDEQLRATRIVGFASHVQTPLIIGARGGCRRGDGTVGVHQSTGRDSRAGAMTRPGISDVHAARHRIADTVHRTPLRHSAWLSELTGGDVWLKLESLQVTHSFKIRASPSST